MLRCFQKEYFNAIAVKNYSSCFSSINCTCKTKFIIFLLSCVYAGWLSFRPEFTSLILQNSGKSFQKVCLKIGTRILWHSQMEIEHCSIPNQQSEGKEQHEWLRIPLLNHNLAYFVQLSLTGVTVLYNVCI